MGRVCWSSGTWGGPCGAGAGGQGQGLLPGSFALCHCDQQLLRKVLSPHEAPGCTFSLPCSSPWNAEPGDVEALLCFSFSLCRREHPCQGSSSQGLRPGGQGSRSHRCPPDCSPWGLCQAAAPPSWCEGRPVLTELAAVCWARPAAQDRTFRSFALAWIHGVSPSSWPLRFPALTSPNSIFFTLGHFSVFCGFWTFSVYSGYTVHLVWLMFSLCLRPVACGTERPFTACGQSSSLPCASSPPGHPTSRDIFSHRQVLLLICFSCFDPMSLSVHRVTCPSP